MKHTKSILMAALAALSLGSASAQTVTYITGSTAFGGAAMPAIAQFVSNNSGTVLAWDSSALITNGGVAIPFTAAKIMLARYVNSGVTNFISVRLTGSEAGVQNCAAPAGTKLVGFLPTNATGTITSAACTVNTNANASFSDTYQGTSRFNGTLAGTTYSSLAGFDAADGIVGIVAFNWVTSVGCPATNMTTQIANQLLNNGSIPLALLTASASDQTNGVYLIGRNIDSGTRLTTFAETLFGTLGIATQYAVGTNFTTNAAGATIQGTSATNRLFLWPVESINGISSQFKGNGGNSSGGTLCGFMTNSYAFGTNLFVGNTPTNSTRSSFTGSNFLVGYAGTSDANGKLSGGLIKMSYNGVANSPAAIEQGQYTFWGYEHLYQGNIYTAENDNVVQGVATLITGTPTTAASGVQLTPNVNSADMAVARTSDGGTVAPLY